MQPGQMDVLVGHDFIPLAPPAAPRSTIFKPGTARDQVSMGGHEKALPMSQ